MGNSTLVTKSHSHTALAEHGQRLRMVEIRDRIHEAKILDLAIAMAQTGRDLYINQETMELQGEEMLDQKVRQAYINQLVNKLINNAVAPKEIVADTDHSRWTALIAAEEGKSSGDDN